MKKTTKHEWQWFGNAGHLIVGRWCQFHLCTLVNGFLVSTVGQYVPDAGVREIVANSRGIQLEGRGDARLADYMKKVGYEPLGAGPHCYETMVFDARNGKVCDAPECNCGLPHPDNWSELDSCRWMTAREAREGHYSFCRQAETGVYLAKIS